MNLPARLLAALGIVGLLGALEPAAAQAPAAIDPEASCTSSNCHSELGKAKVVHPVAADGESCGTCHLPAGEETRHEFTLMAEPPELCYGCHEDWTEGKKTVHPPVADGLCTTCHNPHQSDEPRMLEMPLAELCVMCHADAPFTGDEITHGPVAEGRCVACHNPHSGDNPRMLVATEPELCFGCHNKTQKAPDGTPLPPAEATFDDPEIGRHVPFETGECTMCHLPHAGKNHRLLMAPYPASFYAPFSEDAYFCFQCHDAEAFTEPRTLEATEFRNGNLNLHYRHVNRDKGRTCRACHHHHGARNPKLIRDRVRFGQRFLTIAKYELTETGGTCAPLCHQEVSYDRFSPVTITFRVTPREGKDATAEELQAGRPQPPAAQ